MDLIGGLGRQASCGHKMDFLCRELDLMHTFDRRLWLTEDFIGADGRKRTEVTGGGTTTLVWDGSDYLQDRS